MTRALLAAALAGCTFVGGITGGTIASRRPRPHEASTSIMPGVMTGAGIGMLLDAIVIGFLIDQNARAITR